MTTIQAPQNESMTRAWNGGSFIRVLRVSAGMSSTSPRLWVVTIRATSSIRLKDDTILYVQAGPDSSLPVRGVRLRNWRSEGQDGAMGLLAQAAGEYASAEAAVATLANLASPYLQLAAIAANATISEPFEVMASAPPRMPTDTGTFVVERPIQPQWSPWVRRELDANALKEFSQAVEAHPRKDRLHRAMAHYSLALDKLDPGNWIMAAEHLYMAVENLGRVVHQRLLQAGGLPDTGESKHKLAIAHGFQPANEKDRSHLNRYDAWVRETHVFGGDRDCYKKLLDASDKLEHGLSGFDEIRGHADQATLKAYGYVRRAILREAGVPKSSELFAKRLDLPLGPLRPIMVLEGTYTDTSTTPEPNPDPIQEPWPIFDGLQLAVEIDQVTDGKEDARHVQLKVNGDGSPLSPAQTVHSLKHTLLYQHPEKGTVTIPVSPTEITVHERAP